MQNIIYISFSPYIASVLRKELSTKKDEPIRITHELKATAYWRKKYPYMSRRQLDKQGSMQYLFISALREYNIKNIRNTRVYSLAFSQREVRNNPHLIKMSSLVPFRLPSSIPDGTKQKPTSENTLMDKFAGQKFRQAIIYYFYDLLKTFLHKTQHEARQRGETWQATTAIQQFCDYYDLSSEDYFNILRQYYRHPAA